METTSELSIIIETKEMNVYWAHKQHFKFDKEQIKSGAKEEKSGF
jgi:hypothetical protein